MVKVNKNIDTYIKRAKPFARPILQHIRQLVHQICPEAEETIKWGFPHFMYQGILCSMAAFKEHCAFVFWKGALMKDPHEVMDKARAHSMGQFGRLTSLDDLPSDKIIKAYLKEAMKLNEANITLPKKKTPSKQKVSIPADLMTALQENKKALKTFEAFSSSKKKDYIEWLTEAKQSATRKKRLLTAIQWISEGKSRNWKYE